MRPAAPRRCAETADLEAAARLLEMSNDEIRLMAGEVTAQEMRTVQAVLRGRAAAIRRLLPAARSTGTARVAPMEFDFSSWIEHLLALDEAGRLPMRPQIHTSAGKRFDFLRPSDRFIQIEEIAHALAHMCRFTGHTRVHYSVAQHSLMVSYLVPAKDALAGLLHDAAEALLGDVASPLKQLLPCYKAIEAHVEAAILAQFGLGPKLPKSVKVADRIMLLTEQRDLMPLDPKSIEEEAASARRFDPTILPLPDRLVPISPRGAKLRFIKRFHEIVNDRQQAGQEPLTRAGLAA